MALPKSLVSREMLSQIPGIKCSRASIMPANSSGDFTYNPSGNSRVIFQVPAFENAYMNTQRSFITFKVKAKGTLAPDVMMTDGAHIFRRMLLKNAKGTVVEDIDHYGYLCQIKSNMQTKSSLEAKASTHKDLRVMKTDRNLNDTTDYSTERTVIHELQSGLLGHEQKFMVPLGAMAAGAGHCFQLELWLSDVKDVFSSSRGSSTTGTLSYDITDVSFDIELLEVDPTIMGNINSELQDGASIPLPFKTYRSHVSQISVGSQATINISESAHDVVAVYTVLKKQDAGNVMKKDMVELTRSDLLASPFNFIGGRHIIAAGILTPADVQVTKYSYRYASKYYPLAPVNMDSDSTLALENLVSGLELFDKMPYLSDTIKVGTEFVSRFETDTFMLAQNFKATNDTIINGLNSSSSGSPITIDLSFKTSVTGVECMSFVETNNVLYVGKGGQSGLVVN